MKNSEMFWNGLAIVAQIAIGFVSLELLLATQIFVSALLLGFMFDLDEPPFFMYISILAAIFAIFWLIVVGISFLYKVTIRRFNNWLDKTENKDYE